LPGGSATIVALVGPRCAGKTSVGRVLARKLEWPFVDLDDEIATAHADARGSAPGSGAASGAGGVLAEIGEAAFRDLEERALAKALAGNGPLVLACGGGVVERAAARKLLASRATCVWLRASPQELQRRMRADPTPRPALTGADPVAEIEAVLARREPLYAEVAEIAIDGRGLSPAEIAEEVASRIGRGGIRGCRG